ncbi:MAG: DHA2 family efflux MFS transporter permease subunit [Chloroflexota bacterium]
MSLPDRRRWWALTLLASAQFIVILDTSIIGVALPSIQRALDFSGSDLQWVFNAYVIAFGSLVLLGGRLSDLFGQRSVFMAGFAILALASLLAGLAPSAPVLIVARALQGVGSALVAPAALSLVLGLFGTSSDLPKALGIYGASAPAGGTAGVVLGGIVTHSLSWHWVFLINVPLAAVVLALGSVLLKPGARRSGSLDVLGALAVTASLITAVYTIVSANDAGWVSKRTLGLATVAVALLVTFVVVERTSREPLVPLGVFLAPNLSAGNLVMALLGAAWIPMWFFLNLYLQQILGFDALQGGLALLPMTVLIMLLMIGFTGQSIARLGFKPTLTLGLLILAGATLFFSSAPDGGSFMRYILPVSLPAALGMSLSYIPAMMAATSGVRSQDMGLASGLVNTSYQVGSAIGLAVMTAIAAATSGPGASGLNTGFHAAFVGATLTATVAAMIAGTMLRQKPAARADGVRADRATERRAG